MKNESGKRPETFDKEKIIKALHRKRIQCDKAGGISMNEKTIAFCKGERSAFLEAIEIVKKGGDE